MLIPFVVDPEKRMTQCNRLYIIKIRQSMTMTESEITLIK